MKSTRGKKNQILPASAIADFRLGIDVVVRENGKTLVRDPLGVYADIEVQSDAMPPEFTARLEALPRGKFEIMERVIEQTAVLSNEGRRERLDAIAEIRRARGW